MRISLAVALSVFAFGLSGLAQVSTINIYAGGPALPVNGAPAYTQKIDPLLYITEDGSGGLYVLSYSLGRIYRITAEGTLQHFAGSGLHGFAGDGGPATDAAFSYPVDIARDLSGNVYVADRGNYRVRKITPGGVISTVAGTGSSGFSGDGGSATMAQLVPDRVITD